MKRFFFQVISLLILLSLMTSGGILPVSAQFTDEIIWTVEFDVNIPFEQAERVAGIRLKGETYSVTAIDDTTSMLGVQGGGTFDGLRQLLFAEMMPEFYFLGGAIDLTLRGDFTSEQLITLVLECNPSSGYFWRLPSDSTFTETAQWTLESKAIGRGLPERQTLYLRAPQGGVNELTLVYRRAQDKEEAPTRRVFVQSQVIPETIDLSDPTPLPEFSGFKEIGTIIQPEPEEESAPVRGALPSSFDARNYGWVPAIRNQGSCGSCWAFGTVAAMEIAMKKAASITTDLSEQFLISCNNKNWSCSGGLTASMYHYDTLGKLQSSVGAVLESDMPYTESNGTCAAKSHPYVLSGWHYVHTACGDTQDSCEFVMPTDTEIKQAIYNYGAVTAGVRVGAYWNAYTGGVQTQSDVGNTNHQIAIIGWNDSAGYWIVRNQWGVSDGESGYRRMAYGISRLGEGASYDVYTGTPVEPASNDSISNAATTNYTGGYFLQTFTVNTSGSTTASNDPVISKKIGQGSHSVWYYFYPAGNGKLKLSTAGSDYDTVLALYSGSPGALKKLTFHDNRTKSNKTSLITYKKIKANTVYYIEVTGKGSGGNLNLSFEYTPAKPGNDKYSKAKALPRGMTETIIRLDVEKATTEKFDNWAFSTDTNGSIYHTVWYKFKPYSSKTLYFTDDSNYSSMASIVWLKSEDGRMMPGSVSEDERGGWTWHWDLTGGKQYWLGFGSREGSTTDHILYMQLNY